MTAGFPTTEDTVPILLAMQEGGADIIELGVPFSDPMADGPAIQETNNVRRAHLFSYQRHIKLLLLDRCPEQCGLWYLLGHTKGCTLERLDCSRSSHGCVYNRVLILMRSS